MASVDAAVVGADSAGCDNSAVKQRTALQWHRQVETELLKEVVVVVPVVEMVVAVVAAVDSAVQATVTVVVYDADTGANATVPTAAAVVGMLMMRMMMMVIMELLE